MDKHQRYRLKNLTEYRARKREYAKTDDQREKRRLYMQRWRAKNREKSNLARKDYHARNRAAVNEKQKIRHLQSKYGLTYEMYEAMVVAQEGKCKLCGNVPAESSRRGLHVDHSHVTGKVRALLCFSCNTILGRIESVGIEKFQSYLTETQEF
jgi:hypothetical protein